MAEFYAAATRKLGMTSAEAEAAIRDMGGWIIHRPAHADLLKAAQLDRRYKLRTPDPADFNLTPTHRPNEGLCLDTPSRLH